MSPTREQAFEAFCVLLAYATEPGAPRVYTQSNLPPDCRSRDAFLRRHRQLRKAGVPGAHMRGKVAACTAEAWSADLPKPRKRLAIVTEAASVESEIDSALGIKFRRAAP